LSSTNYAAFNEASAAYLFEDTEDEGSFSESEDELGSSSESYED